VVENVEGPNKKNIYSFNFKGDSKRYECLGGWCFVEDTEEGRRALDVAGDLRAELDRMEGTRSELRALNNKYKRSLNKLPDLFNRKKV